MENLTIDDLPNEILRIIFGLQYDLTLMRLICKKWKDLLPIKTASLWFDSTKKNKITDWTVFQTLNIIGFNISIFEDKTPLDPSTLVEVSGIYFGLPDNAFRYKKFKLIGCGTYVFQQESLNGIVSIALHIPPWTLKTSYIYCGTFALSIKDYHQMDFFAPISLKTLIKSNKNNDIKYEKYLMYIYRNKNIHPLKFLLESFINFDAALRHKIENLKICEHFKIIHDMHMIKRTCISFKNQIEKQYFLKFLDDYGINYKYQAVHSYHDYTVPYITAYSKFGNNTAYIDFYDRIPRDSKDNNYLIKTYTNGGSNCEDAVIMSKDSISHGLFAYGLSCNMIERKRIPERLMENYYSKLAESYLKLRMVGYYETPEPEKVGLTHNKINNNRDDSGHLEWVLERYMRTKHFNADFDSDESQIFIAKHDKDAHIKKSKHNKGTHINVSKHNKLLKYINKHNDKHLQPLKLDKNLGRNYIDAKYKNRKRLRH
jgi:hypothetical protein